MAPYCPAVACSLSGGVMGWSALATAGTMNTATGGEVLASADAGGEDEASGQEPWVFDDIFLAPPVIDAAPSQVVVRIEAELLGFVVEERSAWRRRRSWRTRRSYATTRADAVVEAGRIAHSWLSRGYSICQA